MRFLALCLLVPLSVLAFGQDNFLEGREPSRRTFPFQVLSGASAIQHLKQIHLINDVGSNERQPSSRYEMAVQAHEAWAWLAGVLRYLEHGDKDGRELYLWVKPFEKQLPTASIEIRNLIYEFKTELEKLGADTETMLKEVRSYKDRIRGALAKSVWHGSLEPPEWSVVALRKMKEAGLLVGYPDGMGRIPNSRYERAIELHAVIANLNQTLDDLESRSKQMALGTVDGRTIASLKSEIPHSRTMLRFEPDLFRLVDEFYFELLKLGGDPESMAGDVDRSCYGLRVLKLPVFGEAAALFVDVPQTHWAASATNDLKRAGILIGDGKGHFGG